MRVCFLCGDCSLGGGTERVCSRLADELSEAGGHDIFILSVYEKNEIRTYPTVPGVRRAVLRKKPVRFVASYASLYIPLVKYLRKYGIDVLVDVDSVLDIISLPARAFSGVRVVSWEHFAFDEALGTVYRTRLRRLTARHTDAVVALTHADAERYNREFHLRRPAVCIRNIMPKPAGTEYNALSRKIITVCALTHVKGCDMLIEAAAVVLHRHPDVTWEIYGEGELRETLAQQVRERVPEGRLLLCGFTDNLSARYGDACMYVLTSRSEGLPTVLLEAKTHALPVVAFNCSHGVGELVADGINGVLVAPGDTQALANAVCELLSDEGRRLSYSAHSLDGTEEFEREYVLSRWCALIEDLRK